MRARKITRAELYNFIGYVQSFYGHEGIYAGDFQEPFTLAEVERATAEYLRTGTIPFEGDTVDREAVRDLVLADRARAAAALQHGVTLRRKAA